MLDDFFIERHPSIILAGWAFLFAHRKSQFFLSLSRDRKNTPMKRKRPTSPDLPMEQSDPAVSFYDAAAGCSAWIRQDEDGRRV